MRFGTNRLFGDPLMIRSATFSVVLYLAVHCLAQNPEVTPIISQERPPVTTDAQLPDEGGLGDEVKGLLESPLLYASAWESGDFLVRIRSTFDSVNRSNGEINDLGCLFQQTDYYRVIFDYPNQLFCVMHASEATELDLSRQKDGLEPEQSPLCQHE